MTSIRTLIASVALAAAMLPVAHAQHGPSTGNGPSFHLYNGTSLSDSSALSTLLAVGSVALPAYAAADGARFSVTAVEKTAQGMRYVLRNMADGSQAVLNTSTQAAGSALVAGTSVVVASVVAAGTILMAGPEVLAFIPNELGRSLLASQQVVR